MLLYEKNEILKNCAQIEFTKIHYQREFRDLRVLPVVAIGVNQGEKGKTNSPPHRYNSQYDDINTAHFGGNFIY